jgi:hypothetical protein
MMGPQQASKGLAEPQGQSVMGHLGWLFGLGAHSTDFAAIGQLARR